jgi:hypothetical protein
MRRSVDCAPSKIVEPARQLLARTARSIADRAMTERCRRRKDALDDDAAGWLPTFRTTTRSEAVERRSQVSRASAGRPGTRASTEAIGGKRGLPRGLALKSS